MQRRHDPGEERYRAFIDHSSEGIWRLDFEPPIDTALPVDEQVELAYRNGRFAECNLAMARMSGLESIDDLIGQPLEVVLPPSDPEARAHLTAVVESGYHVTEVESAKRDAEGHRRYFAHSL